MKGTVAVVGRPNVGKSTVFNRIIGERKSIVDDTPGVTRDRIYGQAEWLTQPFYLIDTGGIQLEDQAFADEIGMQVDIAIEEADVILFLVNAIEGVTDDDIAIARKLQKSKKPVVLAVNKADNENLRMSIYDFYTLGLSDPIPMSAEHGTGVAEVLDEIVKYLPDKKLKVYDGMTTFCVIGRPNVGKARSSTRFSKKTAPSSPMWKAQRAMPSIRRFATRAATMSLSTPRACASAEKSGRTSRSIPFSVPFPRLSAPMSSCF